MSTKAEIKASAVYNKKNTVQIALRINVSTESDILNKLNQVPNKMRYIKDLIRKDIMEDAKEKKMYNINDLMKNEDLFKQMLDEIDSSEFKGVKNVNDFLERFDQLDESRDVYVFVNGSFECGCIDEQLHEATGNDGAIEVDAFAQIEMRCAKHVRVYGKATYYNWDEDDNQYRECGFGDYDCIEII